MLYVLPDYYPAFRCLADACPDTCCAGWQISIDPKSLKRYRAYRGDFRPRLLKGIRWNKKVFRQDSHGRCVFLDKKNLCGMYLHMGRTPCAAPAVCIPDTSRNLKTSGRFPSPSPARRRPDSFWRGRLL